MNPLSMPVPAAARLRRPQRPWLSLAAAVMGVMAVPCGRAPAAEQPNIVFILADDLGYMDLGCYGSDLYQTPNIDRLAREGLRFTQAYAACHVCSPTRGSIMTGKYPARTRLTNIPDKPNPYRQMTDAPAVHDLAPDAATIGRLLRKEGYATAWFGKWHIGGGAQESGFDAGHQDWALNRDPSETDPKGALRLTAEAVDFMGKNAGKPMFIALSHYAVHSPVYCNSQVRARYEKLVTPEKRQQGAAYAAMTEALDHSVGVLLKAIEEQHFARETVVMFSSDNGGATKFTCNAPLREGKGWLYEGGIRVPLIVCWPGKVRAGTTSDEAVSSIDLLPTFLQLAGCRDLPDLDGLSLLPVLTQGAHLSRPALYWHFPHYHNCTPCGAIRKGDLKLIEYFEDGRTELYDLGRDPGEQKNLAAAQPEKAAGLLADLRAWRKSVDARMPTPNPNADPAKAKLSANKLKAMEKAEKDKAKGKDKGKGKDKKPKAGPSEDPAEDNDSP